MVEHGLLGTALGFVIGAVLALTGAGGGILAVPVLVFGLGLSVAQAAPVGLFAVGLAATLGALLGLKQGIVRYKAATLVALMGVVMAPVGLHLARQIPNAPLALLFSALLVHVGVRLFRRASQAARGDAAPVRAALMPCVLDPVRGRLGWTLPCARALAGTGLLAGLLSGLLGVGGGFVIVPALTRYTNLENRSIIATSLAIIAMVSLGSVTTAALGGMLLWEAAIPFALGTAAGLMAGRLVAERLSGPRLQQAFAGVTIVAAILLAGKALAAYLA